MDYSPLISESNLSPKAKSEDSDSGQTSSANMTPVHVVISSQIPLAPKEKELTDKRIKRSSIFNVFGWKNRKIRAKPTKHEEKHKSKLEDCDWMGNTTNAPEPSRHPNLSFNVKLLGETFVEKACAEDAKEAVKTVVQMVKAGQKPFKVTLTVTPDGINIHDTKTGEQYKQISIYDIAHCSAQSKYPTMFAFIATDVNNVTTCYCFNANRQKTAQKITLTIAQSFHKAYQMWQNESFSPMFYIPKEKMNSHHQTHWVHFDEEDNNDDRDYDEIDNMVTMTKQVSNLVISNVSHPQVIKSQVQESIIVVENENLICL